MSVSYWGLGRSHTCGDKGGKGDKLPACPELISRRRRQSERLSTSYPESVQFVSVREGRTVVLAHIWLVEQS